MSTTFSVRLDDDGERKLNELGAALHEPSRNALVRRALEIAYRQYVEQQIRQQSAALLNDPDDRAAIREAREAMGADDAW